MDSRERIDMTVGELAWTAFGILGLGVLTGWALFGSHRLAESVLNSGNFAEWMAALGTWGIGWAALRFSASVENARRADVIAQSEALANRTRARLYEISARVRFGLKGKQAFQFFAESEDAEKTQAVLRFYIFTSITQINSIVFSDDDKTYLTEDLIIPYTDFSATISYYVALATELINDLDESTHSPLKDEHPRMIAMVSGVADELHAATTTFLTALNEARNHLGFRSAN